MARAQFELLLGLLPPEGANSAANAVRRAALLGVLPPPRTGSDTDEVDICTLQEMCTRALRFVLKEHLRLERQSPAAALIIRLSRLSS